MIEGEDRNGQKVLYGTSYNGGANGTGSIFAITFSGSLTTVYSFSAATGSNTYTSKANADGAGPDIGLTAGPGGLLYGACINGGFYGEGTIFSFATTGSNAGRFTTLLDVNDSNPNGGNLPPQSSDVCGLTLVMGPDGNLYGTSANYDTNINSPNYSAYGIFQFTPAGGYTEICYGLLGPPQLIFPNANDTLYGLAGPEDGTFMSDIFFDLPITSPPIIGGTADTILDFDKPTSFNSVTGYPVNNDGALPVALFLGRDGNLYGATNTGGANGNGTVFEITSSGTAPIILHTFAAIAAFNGPNADGANPSDLIPASDGKLYGITLFGGANGVGTFFQIDPTAEEPFTLLESFPAGMGVPTGIMQASDGNLYGSTSEFEGASTIFTYPLKPPGGIAVFDSAGAQLINREDTINFGDGFLFTAHPTVAKFTGRIENTGTDDLTIDCVFIVAGPFTVPKGGQPAKQLRPKESTNFEIEMTPNQPVSVEPPLPAPTTQYGEARIISDDPNTPTFVIELSGSGGGPSPDLKKPKLKHGTR